MVGLAVGVVENGEIRFLKGYGETVAGSGEPVTTDTVFRWASLSKGVAADMVALLADEGKLSLYEPVGRNMRPRCACPAATSRARPSPTCSRTGSACSPTPRIPSSRTGWTRAILRATLATLNTICSPGTCHAYQNVAYDAATEIVERVTGQSYAEAVREHLFAPLGMTSASMTREELVTLAQLGAAACRRQAIEAGRGHRALLSGAGGGRGQRLDQGSRHLDAGADGRKRRTCCSPRVLAAVQTPRADTPGETRPEAQVPRADPRRRLRPRLADLRLCRPPGRRPSWRRARLSLADHVRSGAEAGVVALWNGSSGQPGGLEYEVMDMVYRLPPRDWLALDRRSRGRRRRRRSDEDANSSVDAGRTEPGGNG